MLISLSSAFVLLLSLASAQEEEHASVCPEFTCHSDGTCLSFEKMCDRYPHCQDGSDESSCVVQTTPEPPCADVLSSCAQYDIGSKCLSQPDWAWKLCRKHCGLCGMKEGRVRLAGGASTLGRVEVYYQGQWGTVCDQGFDNNAAAVVCRQLGFSRAHFITGSQHIYRPVATQPMWLSNVRCTGREKDFSDCLASKVGSPSPACLVNYRNSTAAVSCSNAIPHGSVRLVGAGATGSRGRVEVYMSGRWGTVCDDSFGAQEANVICRQLGFRTGKALAERQHTFGSGLSTQPIWMDDLTCTGSETTLASCSKATSIDCKHNEDAAVICSHGRVATSKEYLLTRNSEGRRGKIVSPLHGNKYHRNAHVTYNLDLQNPGGQKLRVGFVFDKFELEDCGSVCCDKVLIEGQEYCGVLHGKNVVVETSRANLTVEFMSDDSNQTSGFVIDYSAFPVVPLDGSVNVVKCDEAVTNIKTGYVISPYYPGMVHPNFRCFHELRFSTKTYTVRLEFLNFGFSRPPTTPLGTCSPADKLVTPAGDFCSPGRPNHGEIIEVTTTTGEVRLASMFGREPSVGYVVRFTAWPGMPQDKPPETAPPTFPPPTTTTTTTTPAPTPDPQLLVNQRNLREMAWKAAELQKTLESWTKRIEDMSKTAPVCP